MQKLDLKQKLVQKLTPQQIQLVKLLQIPAIDMNARIEQELAENPVLESSNQNEEPIEGQGSEADSYADRDLDEVSYNTRVSYRDPDAAERWARREASVPNRYSLHEQLLEQLEMLRLDERQHKIALHLIGSLEADGYIRRDLSAIVNDLLFAHYMETNEQEVETVLKKIQNFDPAGIGARNLQECLLIQLNRQPIRPVRDLAIRIITQTFEAFTKKHYAPIMKKLGIQDEQLFKDALDLIAKLNPKPGGALETGIQQNQILYPDFLVGRQSGQLEVRLNSYNTPELKISRSYMHILERTQQANKEEKKSKKLQEATSFVKQKIEAAKWFMEALKQRQKTLLRAMQAIVQLQYDFFLEGDESKLKPMILKDVAKIINMDISTVSRIVNNKSVQTHFGIYPLKFFFTEAISTDMGEDVSSKAVKQALQTLIEQENKKRPYADEELTAMLTKQGYHIARRTVAKYREQLHIPVARLRKGL
ncbi:MAG: RNA polymerase sigma-54 factor [Candidatus Amoebophilus sp. 36-38]|nr:MAG: RNA polymerase sigma-54 factor [Candidatus Amoebophilus sp. 36-38]